MSTKKRTKKEFSFGKFGGVDRTRCHERADSAENIVNFRLLADGSLMRREGTRLFATLPDNIRAVSSTILNGQHSILVLAGYTVALINIETSTVSSIGTVRTASGNGCFFYLKDTLYLADGSSIYRYNGIEFVDAVGYIPTIGVNWRCGKAGEILESRNLLNNRGKITYLVNDTFTPYLFSTEPIESVEALYVNGILRSPSDYSVDKGFNAVVMTSLKEGDSVEVRYIFQDNYASLRNRLFAATSSAIFGDSKGIRVFLLGGGLSGKVFQAQPVSEAQILSSQKMNSNSDKLYFPVGSEFDVCNGTYSATDILRYRDKLLVFTEGDVWMVSSEGNDGVQATGVNAHIGCPVLHGATLSDNDPYSIGRHAVWHWSGASLSENTYRAENISAPVEIELDEATLKNSCIFYNASAKEIWVYSKQHQVAWIYGIDAKAWYKFDGFYADGFFDMDGRVAFYHENKIFVFDKNMLQDTDKNGTVSDIIATYTSGFADPMDEKTRTLSEITVRGELFGKPVNLEIIPDRGTVKSYQLADSKADGHTLIHKRANSGRFKYVRFKLTASEKVRQHIHSLTLTAR